MNGVKEKKESSYIQGICIDCNSKKQRKKGIRKGKIFYSSRCYKCYNKKYSPNGPSTNHKFKYRTYKKKYCEECAFIAIHPCQLDVDHIDGDHNNALDNYRTLCANCHRLKTFLNKEWEKQNK